MTHKKLEAEEARYERWEFQSNRDINTKTADSEIFIAGHWDFPFSHRWQHWQCPMSRHFTVRQNYLLGSAQTENKSKEMTLKWSNLEVDFDLSCVDVTESALEQEVVNKQQTFFNCLKNSPSADRTSCCVDWPRKMSNQRQHMLTTADRIAVFTTHRCRWVFTCAYWLMSYWW